MDKTSYCIRCNELVSASGCVPSLVMTTGYKCIGDVAHNVSCCKLEAKVAQQYEHVQSV